jgi:hypothetical protein
METPQNDRISVAETKANDGTYDKFCCFEIGECLIETEGSETIIASF